jgi:hypothetical protein
MGPTMRGFDVARKAIKAASVRRKKLCLHCKFT